MGESCLIKVRTPGGFIQVDVLEAARTMRAPERKKLFKELGKWISDEDCQRAIDALAKQILDSRARAADEILMGRWPVTPPIPVQALRCFVDAQLSIVLSVCTIPELYFETEKE